eukprot:TRINITY_DN5818_c0_g1_i3.p1 TRINITY_DN5818_c0_g1~~TRINITY_DN5818_c0_g1_i3.p1  ORF type:complete len:952 (+),score=135.40 TRINITY_DN5818_c0_g1_i3:162-3017(+)
MEYILCRGHVLHASRGYLWSYLLQPAHRSLGHFMFYQAAAFNRPIGEWNTSSVVDMSYMLKGATSFNQPIGHWDTSAVTTMVQMFELAVAFDQPIGSWNVSSVVDMAVMFNSATSFNHPIGDWDTSAVTNMQSMFQGSSAFNQPIGDWDTSAVKNMDKIFSAAPSFDQPLALWDTSAVTSFDQTFYAASNFNQVLLWDAENAIGKTSEVLAYTKLDACAKTHNYRVFAVNGEWKDETLVVAWSQLSCPRCDDANLSCPHEGLACLQGTCRPLLDGFLYVHGKSKPSAGVRGLKSELHRCKQEENCGGLILEPDDTTWTKIGQSNASHDTAMWLKSSCSQYACPEGTTHNSSARLQHDVSRLACCLCENPSEHMQDDGSCRSCPAGEAVRKNALLHAFGCQRCQPGKYSPSEGAVDCTECEAGRYAASPGSSTCQLCPEGFAAAVAGQTACQPCGVFQRATAGSQVCAFDYVVFAAVAGFGLCVFALASILMSNLHFRLPIADVSCQHWVLHEQEGEKRSAEIQATLLTTCLEHRLRNYQSSSFPVRLSMTSHPALDDRTFLAHVEDEKRIRLLDEFGKDMEGSFDTSSGHLSLSFKVAMLQRGMLFPSAVWFVLLLGTAGSLLPSAIQHGSGLYAVSGILGSVLAISKETYARWHRYRVSHDALKQSLVRFSRGLPLPIRTPKGASRGLSLSELLKLRDSFGTFLCNRNAYYLVGNIIKPLSKPSRVSYAELVGPKAAKWFVSHYWGTPFRHFCQSLEQHATGFTSQQEFHDVAYWVCFCANNQFDVSAELGTSVYDSSFYLALQGGVLGTCMVLDERAVPLTRSWCIFEVLQTLQLESSNPAYEGLLFCTAGGVLNRGEGSADVISQLGERIASLDLEKAEASDPKDNVMIQEEVIKSLGSFSEMNRVIRNKTSDLMVEANKQQMLRHNRIRRLLNPEAEDFFTDAIVMV